MGNKIKLQRLGENSLWLLERIGKDGFQVTDLVVTSYIQAFLPQLRSHPRGRGFLETVLARLTTSHTITKADDGTYQVTKQGNWELARRRMLDDQGNHVPTKWDRKWRIIIFDIPELERPTRDALRYAISKYGMYQLQQSVWVYPYPCDGFITSVKNDLNFKAEVLFIVANNIENQSKLEEEFGLL